jgi:hypothetical protein
MDGDGLTMNYFNNFDNNFSINTKKILKIESICSSTYIVGTMM